MNVSYHLFPRNSSLLLLLTSSSSFGGSEVVDYLNICLTPVIVVVGVVGNSLSLSVFSLTHLKRLSSSLYLSALSVADIVFLLALLVVWLERVNITLFSRNGWCQTVLYSARVSGFLAVWNVVSFTGERYVTVYHPLRKDALCTKRRARSVVACLVLFALSFYAFTAWTYEVVRFDGVKPFCAPLPQYQYLITVMTSLDTILASFAPSLLIVILNVRIIRKIRRYQTQAYDPKSPSAAEDALRMRAIVHTSVSASGSMHIKFSSNSNKKPQKIPTHRTTAVPGTVPASNVAASVASSSDRVRRLVRGQTQYRTARMLLILSSVTVLLNLPNHVFRLQSFFWDLIGSRGPRGPHTQRKFKWQELFEILYFLNFAVNFFIYSACGRQFRTGLARLCARIQVNVHKCGLAIYYGTTCHRNFGHRRRRKADGYNT